jgi:Tfp pilus assembly protein PilF
MARLSIEPFDMPVRVKMARLFYIEQNPWAAQLTLEDTLEKDPKSALAFLWLGHTLRIQNQPTEAIKAYEKAVDLDSSLAEGFDALGLLYLDQSDASKALKNIEKAQKLLPDNLQVLVHLGNCYEAMGDPQKALKKYAFVLEKNPKQLDAQLNSGLVALGVRDYAKAEKYLKDSLPDIKNNDSLKARVAGYLKMVSSQLQLEKQRHEKAS